MTQYNIPLSAIPAQEFPIILDNQDCTVSLYMRGNHYYFDLLVSGSAVYTGILVQTGESLTPFQYRGFSGEIKMIDADGKAAAPDWKQFGTRFLLIYNDGQN